MSLTPLLLLAVNVYIAYRWARRLAATQRAAVGAAAWSDVALRGVVPGFLGGYLLMAGVFALLTLGGRRRARASQPCPARCSCRWSPWASSCSGPTTRSRPPSSAPSSGAGRRGCRPCGGWAGSGAGLLLAVGVGRRRAAPRSSPSRRCWSIQSDYGVNVGGAVIVGIAQLALLGNAVTWALGFVAGPGFALALGSTVSPAAAAPGLLPLVPVLGAVPEAADYPSILYAVLLLPVAAGVLIGRRVDRELEFFGDLRARVTATAVAALIAVVVVVAVTALGNGAVGVDRLRAVGRAPAALRGRARGRGASPVPCCGSASLLLRERHGRGVGPRPRTRRADRTADHRATAAPADRGPQRPRPQRLRVRRTTPSRRLRRRTTRSPPAWVSRRPGVAGPSVPTGRSGQE